MLFTAVKEDQRNQHLVFRDAGVHGNPPFFRRFLEPEGLRACGQRQVISQHASEQRMGFTGAEQLPFNHFFHRQQQVAVSEQAVELFFKERLFLFTDKEIERAGFQGGQADEAVGQLGIVLPEDVIRVDMPGQR